MKVFLSVDMEGVGGIVSVLETDPEKGGERYEASRHLMTQEVNAAIDGCRKAGADEFLVADSHWNFDNLIPEELDEDAVLLRGRPRPFSMVHGLDGSSDAAMFIGFHAMAGTARAVIDHTFTGRIRSVDVNGRAVGEVGINAYLAGHHGVAVVLVTGDAAVAAEASALIPGVHTVAVKEATGATAAKNLHPNRARERIRAAAQDAIRDLGRATALQADRPVRMSVDFHESEHADRAELAPAVHRVGGTRIEFSAADFLEAFRIFYAATNLSGL